MPSEHQILPIYLIVIGQNSIVSLAPGSQVEAIAPSDRNHPLLFDCPVRIADLDIVKSSRHGAASVLEQAASLNPDDRALRKTVAHQNDTRAGRRETGVKRPVWPAKILERAAGKEHVTGCGNAGGPSHPIFWSVNRGHARMLNNGHFRVRKPKAERFGQVADPTAKVGHLGVSHCHYGDRKRMIFADRLRLGGPRNPESREHVIVVRPSRAARRSPRPIALFSPPPSVKGSPYRGWRDRPYRFLDHRIDHSSMALQPATSGPVPYKATADQHNHG